MIRKISFFFLISCLYLSVGAQTPQPIKQFLRALGNYSITINDTTKATYKSFQTMYPDPVILLAAQQCAKWGMTTLQDVMQTLMAWQNRSLRTLPEIDAYMRQIDEQNEFLIVLYQAMQLDEKAKPNAADRALVKQWTEEWRFAQMFVLGCAPWAAGKKSPMAYLNKMLKVFREKGITTMEAAKAADEDGTGFLYQMFKYELDNHEYGYTGDLEDTLDCLGLTWEELKASPVMLKALDKASTEIREREGC